MRERLLLSAIFSALNGRTVASNAWGLDGRVGSQCLGGECLPGREVCGAPFQNAPVFHLMDQHGCGENDPNGPVFDPVHGVVHHFYQIHLAASPGHGPDYGHFVSKDFVHWAPMPVAIWNGLDSSVWPPRVTPYDNEAIYTGSAVIVEGAGPGGKRGVVHIYPGLCNKNDWPACQTGTVLAQVVPADYENDPLLTNWTKPSYNPIMENVERDPSTPWKTPSGEWRLRTFNSKFYGAASDADLLAGKWYEIGSNPDMFRQCECPSFYPLPSSTPGFEAAYNAAQRDGKLPTHVHKTSCGGDFWQIGTYDVGAPNTTGTLTATPGWEDLFQQKKIDRGKFYASKDNEYPTKSGGKRRINWGWAVVPPDGVQSLPREITFNAAARSLQQAPIQELESLRGIAAYSKTGIRLKANDSLSLDMKKTAKQSELVATFELPQYAATFGVTIGKQGDGTTLSTYMQGIDLPDHDYKVTHHPPNTDPSVCQAACAADAQCKGWTYALRGEPVGSGDCVLKNALECPLKNAGCTSGAKEETTLLCQTKVCTVEYAPPTNTSAPYNEVNVQCSGVSDLLRLLPEETTVEIRIFSDWTFLEAYFQKGRVAITIDNPMDDETDLNFTSTAPITVQSAVVYPMNSIWVSPEDVRNSPRVYPEIDSAETAIVI